MAKTTRKAGKRATAAGRGELRARKAAVAKTHDAKLRKLKPARPGPRKGKPSLPSETTSLKRQLKAARLQQQASAEILRAVANASGDVARPLQQIAETTARLFGAPSVSIQLVEGTEFTQEYRVGAIAQRVGSAYPRSNIRVGGRNLPGTVVFENRQIHIPDLDHLDPSMSDFPGLPHARAGGARTVCGTPLRREGKAIGVFIIFRNRLLPFTDDELALQQSFADQAVIAIENARLFNEVEAKSRELGEALQQQTATAEVLQVTSNSPGELGPVFRAVLENATRICDAKFGTLLRFDGNAFYFATDVGTPAALAEYVRRPGPFQGLSGGMIDRILKTRQMQHTPDYAADAAPGLAAKLGGARSALGVPILKDDVLVGAIVIYRQEVRPFSNREIELVRSFAAQAAIAIENARLFNETQEALERQTATADILKVIANSPTNVQPVFEAIAERSKRLVDALSTTVFRLEDGVMYLRAFTPTNPEADATLKAMFPAPLSYFSWSEAIGNGEIYRVVDTELEIEGLRELARLRGFRSMLFVPLLCDRKPIGVIAVTRVEPGPFVEHHVQLLQTFADQAVIAIENVRLFDEVQAKTRDLTEALQQQTATADVLKVISRSAFDLQTVLETLTRSAVELSTANRGIILLRDGELFRFRAHSHPDENPDWISFLQEHPQKAGRNSASARAIQSGQIVCIPDVLADPEIDMPATALAGIRAVLAVPLLRDGNVEGLMVLSRPAPGPFNVRQIDLVQTFADQALIAIENVRLFDEVQSRTRELSESLQFQTASGEVLKVISRSPDTLQPVLDVIVETSRVLCNALTSIIFLLREGEFHDVAESSEKPDYIEALRANPIPLNKAGSVLARAAREKRTIHVANTAEDPEFGLGGPLDQGGPRSLLSVPLIQDGRVIGGIALRQSYLTPFTPRQIEAVETFADQAVIAISNVNLFEQVQQRTRELAASLDDLRTAQDRLIQTEKLASLGQLTAGIAHEIKNPLNFVNNFSALSAELTDELNDVLKPVAMDVKVREEVDELTGILKNNLEKVVQHGKRADSIVKNMLLHSREGSGENRPVDINALVEESLNLAYHGARAEKPGFNITLQRDFDPVTGTADVYPQEITRVLLNMISNGFYAATRRAVNSGDGFEPTLRAATKNLGDRIEIRIRDNGTGIAPELKEKIFNPFFTTKPAGEGTGLGLSMSHDIVVKQHGGRIDVVSQPGQFTEFTIVLPRATNPSNNRKN